MKKTVSIIVISCVALLAGCSSDKEAEPAADSTTQQTAPAPAPVETAPEAAAHTADMHANHPAMPGHPPAAQAAPANQHQGKVLNATHAAGYTYIEVDINGEKTWIAASPVNVKRGDIVGWSGGATMSNFTSKSLRKTFDKIIFTDQVSVIK